jgi:MFS family permease
VAYAVSQTMLIPALPEIAETLDATPGEVTVLMTSFWVAGAVTAGLFGRLGDMFGKRRMILVQLVLFCLGGLTCALATTLPGMIAGRVLMGCSVGLFPLAYSLIRDELPPKRVVQSIALIGGVVASGAAFGQAVGGVVSDSFGFRWVFWISLAFGLASIAAIAVFVPESSVQSGGRVDIVGALLLAAGLTAPLIALAEVPDWGWTGTSTLVLFGVGGVLLVALGIYERSAPNPLLDVPTLFLPRVRLTNAATLFVGFGFFGFSIIMTQFFQVPSSTGYGFGASATQAGLFLIPGLLLQTATAPLAGRLSSVAGPVVTFRLGIAIATAGIAAMAFSHTHRWEMYLYPALVYVGIGATFGAMPAIILQAVPSEHSGQSGAINMILRTAGSAIGIQLGATLVTQSIGPSGLPADHGYTAAFCVAAAAGLVALMFALRIPSRRGSVWALDAPTSPLLDHVSPPGTDKPITAFSRPPKQSHGASPSGEAVPPA